MEAYRFRKYFKEILSDTTVAYFTIFAPGRLEVSAKGNSVNLIVDDLRHLDIVRGKSKEAGASKDTGGSEPSKTKWMMWTRWKASNASGTKITASRARKMSSAEGMRISP